MENNYYDHIVTFTFCEQVNFDKNFVEALENAYGKENVKKIDQSTYGISHSAVVMDDLLKLIIKTEERGEKCKEGSEICLMTADSNKRQIISSSWFFQSRLNKVK